VAHDQTDFLQILIDGSGLLMPILQARGRPGRRVCCQLAVINEDPARAKWNEREYYWISRHSTGYWKLL